jgi:hypothetical protein
MIALTIAMGFAAYRQRRWAGCLEPTNEEPGWTLQKIRWLWSREKLPS